MTNRYLSVAEVARVLSCHKDTIRRYINEGKLPAQALPGGFYRVKEADIARFLRPATPAGVGE